MTVFIEGNDRFRCKTNVEAVTKVLERKFFLLIF